jgi:3-oxoacyl-[acyl-carrier protein] reductase
MQLSIEGKVAVITGASEGIGRAVALGLAKEGARVAISARRKREIEDALSEIRDISANDQVIAFSGDMSKKASVQNFIDRVMGEWLTVHILVNNVGRATVKRFEDLSMEDWNSAMEINLLSAIHCSQTVLPVMKEQRWGRIINISSISGREPGKGLIASNVTKSGVISFSKSLSLEVANDGILVNCVCPGRILSAQTSRILKPEERQKMAVDHIPLGRFGKAEEVADLIVFLSSERASYITGAIITIDGGMSKGLF